jgi:hypothetical protein
LAGWVAQVDAGAFAAAAWTALGAGAYVSTMATIPPNAIAMSL